MTDTYRESGGRVVIDKRIDGVLDYTFSWNDWLADIDDILVSYTVSSEDTGLTIDATFLSEELDNAIVVMISGGESPNVYEVKCQITTAGISSNSTMYPRTDSRSIWINVIDR